MTATVDLYQTYLAAGTAFQRMVAPAGVPVVIYGQFNRDRRPLLPFVDTGLIHCGAPSQLKAFNSIRFGGSGTLFVRVLVDDSYLCMAQLVLSEDAYQANVLSLPNGTAGYGIRLQLAGVAWWRYFDIDWDPVREV